MDKAGPIAQPVGHAFAQIVLHISDDDATTFFDKSLRRSLSDPGSAPGEHSDFIPHAHGLSSSRRLCSGKLSDVKEAWKAIISGLAKSTHSPQSDGGRNDWVRLYRQRTSSIAQSGGAPMVCSRCPAQR